MEARTTKIPFRHRVGNWQIIFHFLESSDWLSTKFSDSIQRINYQKEIKLRKGDFLRYSCRNLIKYNYETIKYHLHNLRHSDKMMFTIPFLHFYTFTCVGLEYSIGIPRWLKYETSDNGTREYGQDVTITEYMYYHGGIIHCI